MEVIATKRGGQKLCFEGFMYTYKNETTDKLIWRCVNRDDAVKYTAILQTSKNMDNPDTKKPQPFLLHDNGPDADERVVIFAKEHHIQKLADSDVWCMDGNFAMAPSIFMQLYVIQGRVSGVFCSISARTLTEKDSDKL